MIPDRTARRLGAMMALAVTALATATRGPAHPAEVILLDPFTVTAAEVADHRRTGTAAACLLRVDVWEAAWPDAGRFPPEALGSPTGAAPGERWLDPRGWHRITPVLTDRARLCRDKGFERICWSARSAKARPAAGDRPGAGRLPGPWLTARAGVGGAVSERLPPDQGAAAVARLALAAVDGERTLEPAALPVDVDIQCVK